MPTTTPMPSVSIASVLTNASSTADIASFGTYFNNTLLYIAFAVTVGVLIVRIAYTWIIKRGVKGAAGAIGVKMGGRGRRRRR